MPKLNFFSLLLLTASLFLKPNELLANPKNVLRLSSNTRVDSTHPLLNPLIESLTGKQGAPAASFVFTEDNKCLQESVVEEVTYLKAVRCGSNQTGLKVRIKKSKEGLQLYTRGKCLSRDPKDYLKLSECGGDPTQNFNLSYSKDQDTYKLFYSREGQDYCLDHTSKRASYVYFIECDPNKKYQNIHLSYRSSFKSNFKHIFSKQPDTHLLNLRDGNQLLYNPKTGIVSSGPAEDKSKFESRFLVQGTHHEFTVQTSDKAVCLTLSNNHFTFEVCDNARLDQKFRMAPVFHLGLELMAIQSFHPKKCMVSEGAKVMATECQALKGTETFITLGSRPTPKNAPPKPTPDNDGEYELDTRHDNLEIPRFTFKHTDDSYTLVNDYYKTCLKRSKFEEKVILGNCTENDERIFLVGNEQNFQIQNSQGLCLAPQPDHDKTVILTFTPCTGATVANEQAFSLKREHLSFARFKLKVVNNNSGQCLDAKSIRGTTTKRALYLNSCADHLNGQHFHFYNSIVELKLTDKLPPVPSEDALKQAIKDRAKGETLRNRKKPPIFFVFMDTLRFDYLTPELAPHITKFFKSAQTYKGLGGATNTEHSLFSMMYSQDGFYKEPYDVKGWSMGPPSLYYLKKQGYKVSAFGNSEWHFDTKNTNKSESGVPNYNYNTMLFGKDSKLVDSGLTPFAKEKISSETGGLDHGNLDQQTLEKFEFAVNSRITPLKTEGGEIFFLLLSGCHEDYAPYLAPHLTKKYHKDVHKFGSKTSIHEITSPADRQRVRNLYENTIIGFDFQFGQLVKFLKEVGLYDQSIIVLFSDHGEGLFEKEEFSHGGTALTSKSDVPVALKFPKDQPSLPNVQRNLHFSLKDLWPTIINSIVEDYPSSVASSVLGGKPVLPSDKVSDLDCNIIVKGNGDLGVFEFTAVGAKHKAVLQFGLKDAPSGKIGQSIESDTLHVISILDSKDNQLILSQDEKRSFFMDHFKDCVEKHLKAKLSPRKQKSHLNHL